MIHKFIITILLLTTLNASNLEELYINADKYEKENNLEKTLSTYKEIAKKERRKKEYYIDENIEQEIKMLNDSLTPIEDKETYETIEQIVASKFDLYPYRENYFFPVSYDIKSRTNRSQIETKFQLSVRKPLITNLMGINETINIAYTQTSWWQLYEESSPFRETNYRPEIFVNFPFKHEGKTLQPVRIGLVHESNGQPEPKSRSWNRIYMSTLFQYKDIFILPQVWYRIPERSKDDDNPDINEYMGYGDITIAYPYKRHTFKMLLRNNMRLNKKNKGFVQFDWNFPLFGSKNTFGYIQASSGYGDSLIDYDKEVNRISFGISLSR